MELRYGTNPHQTSARMEALASGREPVRLVSGSPSYINLLDALNAWELVREARRALGVAAATSFKHVSPAGAAVAGSLDAVAGETWGVDPGSVGAVAAAYLRARDADPKSSFGDLVAVSDPVDAELAAVLQGVVSDGIVAPGFEPGTVELLAAKKSGAFLVLEADPSFDPPAEEAREVFGARLVQERDAVPVHAGLLAGAPAASVDDLLLGMVVLRFTQSNSVGYVRDGMMVGIGAGQQSRVDCTKLAGAKVDSYWLRRHEKVRSLPFRRGVRRQDRINWQIRFIEGDLTAAERVRFEAAIDGEVPGFDREERDEWLARLSDLSFVSDGAIPFRDNIDQAARHGVRVIAEPGGMRRSEEVAEACREYGITLVQTGVRLFHH